MKTGNELAVHVQGLVKTYKDVRAVDGLEISVRQGEIYGFLGRNGAGKTSTIRMMLGLTKPDAGRIAIFGMDSVRDKAAILKRCGSLVESATAYPNLTVRENLDIQRRLTLSPRSSVGSAIEKLGLEPYADRCFGKLSLGNKQRVALARSILHAPELLILDEPANGLDPAGIAEIRELLRGMAKDRGTTVFVSSHILGEVALLADTIGIIHRGAMVAEFASQSMAELAAPRIELETGDTAQTVALIRSLDRTLAVEAGEGPVITVRGPARHPGRGELRALAAEISKAVVGADIELYRIAAAEENLESVFMRLTGGAE